MNKTIRARLDDLEKKMPDNEPPYITIQEGDEIPEGYKGKVYIGISPDDWDEVDDEKVSPKK